MINKYSIFNGAKYFSSGALQDCLVFISANKYINFFSGTQEIYLWKYKGMSEESIKSPPGVEDIFAPSLINLSDVKFSGNCLINNNASLFRKVLNLYIFYTLDTWSGDLNTGFTLGNCLFGAVKLNENTDPDKCGHSVYGIGFDPCSQFL